MSKLSRPRRSLPKPAYRDLADYLDRSGDTQQNIARRVGTTQAHISKIARGASVPRFDMALRIATYCHIPMDSFYRAAMARRARVVA